MAVYDHKQGTLIIGATAITDFSESGDTIVWAPTENLGNYTHGSGGGSVFVTTGNEGGTLTVKLIQHSPDNKMLNDMQKQQIMDIGNFAPIDAFYKDTINGDVYKGEAGYFETRPTITRGNVHNEQTWVISFKKITYDIQGGK